MTDINPAITVIICMYKGEATVCRMIDCVLNQTFKDFELILVNDGSPDRCGEIADEYAQKDNRVRVLHKPNGGLADARNHALDIARGEYTIQFDQDDWVEPDCLEGMYAEEEERPLALKNRHMLFSEAAGIAGRAGAAALMLTHFSTRLEDPAAALAACQDRFENSWAAHDGMVVTLQYPREQEPAGMIRKDGWGVEA